MISLPGTVVARAIGDVFRQSAAEAFQREQQCKALFLRTFKKLSLLSIPPFVLLFFFVEDLFALVFGEEWREAGKYAQILMPMFLIQFIVSPLSAMFLVAEKQKIDFLIQICLILGILSAIYGGHYFYNDPKITLILYSAVYSVKYVVEFFLSYKFSKGK
jgi:O-antigen/teichoic acid export membrane protein